MAGEDEGILGEVFGLKKGFIHDERFREFLEITFWLGSYITFYKVVSKLEWANETAEDLYDKVTDTASSGWDEAMTAVGRRGAVEAKDWWVGSMKNMPGPGAMIWNLDEFVKKPGAKSALQMAYGKDIGTKIWNAFGGGK